MSVSLDMTAFASLRARSGPPSPRAFTLIELLVSMTVLAVLMLLVTQVIGQVQKTWAASSSRVSQFREARAAFDLVTHNLSQAILNPYWDTDKGGLSADDSPTQQANRQAEIPTTYVRKSDLQFITGKAGDSSAGPGLVQGAPDKTATHLPFYAVFFQATLGVTQTADYERMQNLLCGRGYFIQYGSDAGFRPPFVNVNTNRFRLMEYSPTSEQNLIYYDQANSKPMSDWYKNSGLLLDQSAETNTNAASNLSLARGFTRPVAENIIALIIAPRVSAQQAQTSGKDIHWIASQYAYDSTVKTNISTANPQGTQHLLPPLLDVVMIAIDEASQDNFTTDDISQLQSLFTNASQLDADITSVQKLLVNRPPPMKPVNFRVFKTTVEIRAARWSL